MRDGACATGSNICGTGAVSRPWRRMSPTTPTTVNQAGSAAGGPSAKRRPTASRPGQRRPAIAALTIATRAGPRPSAAVKVRPPRSGVPSASKTPPAISSRRRAIGCAPARSLPSAVTSCWPTLPTNSSLLMPARSTPGTRETRSRTAS